MENKNAYSTLFEQGEQYDYSYCEGEPKSYETVSYAGGKKRKLFNKKPKLFKKKPKLFKKIGGNINKRQAARQKQKSTDSKNTQLAIKAMSKTDKAFKLPPLPKEEKTGMSTGMKVGIGAGILLLAIGGFIAYKKFSKK